jgi:hypothetical protein
MDKVKQKIWIIGRGTYALGLIYALKSNYELNLITSEYLDIAIYGTNKLNKVIYIEPPKIIGEYNYVKNIMEIVGSDLIIPVGEETIIIEYILNKYPQLNNQINLFGSTISSNIKYHYHNKENFYQLIKNLNIDHIDIFTLDETKKLLSVGSEPTGPTDPTYPTNQTYPTGKYLLKPKFSRGGLNQIILDKSNIDEILLNPTIPVNYIIQKYIYIKKEYSVFAIVNHGQIINNVIIYESLDMFNGFATKRKIISNNDILSKQIIQIISKILKHISYSGFIGFDFIFDGNKLYPVDFNPRITNGIAFIKSDSFDPFNYENNEIIIGSDIILSLIPYLILNKYNLLNIFFIENDLFRSRNIFNNLKLCIMIIFKFIYLFVISLLKNKTIEDLVIDSIITCDQLN